MNRREALMSGATALAGGAALLRASAARADPPAPAAPAGAHTPVVMPNGSTLPWTMVDGAKEFHLIAEPVKREFAPGMIVERLGLQRADARPHDRERRGGPRAPPRDEQAPRAHQRPLARHAAPQRDGRRRGPDAAAHPAGGDLRVRVHPAPARHADVPPALGRDGADGDGHDGLLRHPPAAGEPARRSRLRHHAPRVVRPAGRRHAQPQRDDGLQPLHVQQPRVAGHRPAGGEDGRSGADPLRQPQHGQPPHPPARLPLPGDRHRGRPHPRERALRRDHRRRARRARRATSSSWRTPRATGSSTATSPTTP